MNPVQPRGAFVVTAYDDAVRSDEVRDCGVLLRTSGFETREKSSSGPREASASATTERAVSAVDDPRRRWTEAAPQFTGASGRSKAS